MTYMISINNSVTSLVNTGQSGRRAQTLQASPSPQSQSAGAASSESAAPDWRALFTGTPTPEATQPAQTNSAPTAESVFGANPWVTNPTGVGPWGTYSFNPLFFATPQTAAKVAEMLGGSVVPSNELVAGGTFTQQQPNQMVRLPDGRLINAGLVASFYTHGYPQSYIDQMIANAVREA
jgi:hypothetical protein